MELFLASLTPVQMAVAFAVTLFAGFVKGAIGFAMPMLMLSAFGSFLPAELALALLILPTLLTNFAQAFRRRSGCGWAFAPMTGSMRSGSGAGRWCCCC